MKAEQTAIPFHYASHLDLRTWYVDNGCRILTLYKSRFSQQEIDYLLKKLDEHQTESKNSSFISMQELADEVSKFPNAGAFLEFARIYYIASTFFDIEAPVTPQDFIAWAIGKTSIRVHADLVVWLEEERRKSKTGSISDLRNNLKEAQRRAGELETVLDAKDAELEQANAELAALQEENAALKAELEEAKEALASARHEAPPQGATSQQKAAQTRSENALAAWKPVIGNMLRVAVIIGEKGPKERQTRDLYVYFNEMDADITDEQMKFFRRSLPPEYKDTVGGAVGKI